MNSAQCCSNCIWCDINKDGTHFCLESCVDVFADQEACLKFKDEKDIFPFGRESDLKESTKEYMCEACFFCYVNDENPDDAFCDIKLRKVSPAKETCDYFVDYQYATSVFEDGSLFRE